MMRTLQLGLDWFPESPGGLSRYYYDLFHALGGTGVEVRGIVEGSRRVAAESDGRVSSFSPAGVRLPVRLLASRREVRRVIQLFQPDIVAAHFALYALPSLDILRSTPLVVHFHGPWAFEAGAEGGGGMQTRIKQVMERAVYARAARFVVLSRAFGQLLHEHYDIPQARITVVPGGVDTARFATGTPRQESREMLGWPRDRPIILTLRRLVHRMGLERLIDAITEVRKKVPDVLLLIGGKGPLARHLQGAIDAADLGRNVRLLGYVPDEQLPHMYRAADVSVVPTVALEGFGLTTTESLAAGTPVMVTPIGGLPEAVAELSSDLIFESSSADDIADGLCRFLAGKLRIPDQATCAAYARTRFDWAVAAPKILDVYRSALAVCAPDVLSRSRHEHAA